MSRYLFHPDELTHGVRSEQSGLQFLTCQRIELSGERSVVVESGAEEVALVCIAGEAEYACGGMTGVAQGKDFLYLPWRSRIELRAPESAVLMRVGAPSDRDTDFAHIRFADVAHDARHKVVGRAETNCRRDVFMVIDDRFNAARLLMGIGQGGAGGWTVWPPHEHGDEKEELYVYLDMGQAFAIQCIYETLDAPLFCGIVREGDMVAVARGYHPNVGCPAGRIAYLYAMAARVPGQREFMALHIQREFGDKFE